MDTKYTKYIDAICHQCGWKGKIKMRPCDYCEGEGSFFTDRNCKKCGGTGFLPVNIDYCPECGQKIKTIFLAYQAYYQKFKQKNIFKVVVMKIATTPDTFDNKT